MLTRSSQRISNPMSYTGHIYMKYAHCAETNEKSIFRFLIFELWLIVFEIFRQQDKKNN